MEKTKFQIGDKVRFLITNRDFGYLKGATGVVVNIDRETHTVDRKLVYLVDYRHIVTGEIKECFFHSYDLEKVEDKPKYSEFNPDFAFNTHEIEELEIEPKEETGKQESNMFEVDDSSSWNDFCNNFKGELFKD